MTRWGRAFITPAAESTDRMLGLLIAICGTIMLFVHARSIREQAGFFPTWWNVCAALLAVSTLGMIVLIKYLPLIALRVYWVALPVLAIVLQLLAVTVLPPDATELAFPWVWYLEPVFVASLVLVLRPGPAISISIFSGLSPGISALIVLGRIPIDLAGAIPVHLGNVVFVVLIVGIRARLLRLRAIEAELLEVELRRNKAIAEKEREAALSRLIHDEVLSVLGAAALFRGEPPAILRDEARKATAVLLHGARDTPTPHSRDGHFAGVRLISTDDAVAWLLELLAPIVHGVSIATRCTPGTLPAKVVENVGRAAAEALRNSRRHAGVGARRQLEIAVSEAHIDVRVGDDGAGFEPATVSPERFGLRQSIHACMQDIGGTAHVAARPGEGATVRLEWVAP